MVWCGNYRFGEDDSFFPLVVSTARRYADKEPEARPPVAQFREALKNLRDIAPADGAVLLDQLEHRWVHPHCPPALYALTCTLRAPDRGALVSDSGELVQELVCTKIGQAKRTIAARITTYKTQVLGGVSVAARSPTLRVVIYGDSSAMLLEHEIQAFARSVGSRAEVVEEDRRRHVGDETYLGVQMIEAICAFARQRERP